MKIVPFLTKTLQPAFKVCCIFHKNRHISSFGAVNVFDRNAKRRQKDRASMSDDPSVYDYLRDAIAGHIVDRVYDVSRSVVSLHCFIGTLLCCSHTLPPLL